MTSIEFLRYFPNSSKIFFHFNLNKNRNFNALFQLNRDFCVCAACVRVTQFPNL